MADLHVKDIPDPLDDRIRRHAQAQNSTISGVVLIAIERELARLEWQERLAAATAPCWASQVVIDRQTAT